MKSTGCTLVLVVMSLSALVVAQSRPAPSDAQKSFDTLKTLAGNWDGSVKNPYTGKTDAAHVTLRVTSRGNAIVDEMKDPSTPDDPTRYDHPVTVFYLDGNRLLLTHYCDAGNRPRMVASTGQDGKKVEFDLLDLSGGNQNGHMYHVLFTIIDANHHTEDWSYMMPGDKPINGHIELHRVQ